MVIFRSPDGKPGYHQADTLDAAVRFVERLRNDDHVTDARVFRMDEVPIEFKVYYRVEVATDATGANGWPAEPAAAEEAPAPEAAAEDAPPSPSEAASDAAGEPAAAGSAGRFSLRR